MKQGRILSVLMTTLFCSALFADQIVLKNGDRLSGAIIKSDDKTLAIKTDSAGEVTVPWAAVQDMTSTQELHVGLKNGQRQGFSAQSWGVGLRSGVFQKPPAPTPRNRLIFQRPFRALRAFQKDLE